MKVIILVIDYLIETLDELGISYQIVLHVKVYL